jgi:hypothetical protein
VYYYYNNNTLVTENLTKCTSRVLKKIKVPVDREFLEVSGDWTCPREHHRRERGMSPLLVGRRYRKILKF